jgi:HSP20 family molecular chaperone IbpA
MSKRRRLTDIIEEYMSRLEGIIEDYLAEVEERNLWHPSSEAIEPLANVYVEPREVVITVDIPCADSESARVRFVDENTVEIEANLQRTLDFSSLRVTHRSGRFKKYHIRIDIPVPVDPSRASITCYRNVLEVRVPRK